MAALLEHNTAIISCDEKHLPVGLMLSLDGNTLQSERFNYQIEASDPLKKNLWAQTVKSKIENQADLLARCDIDNKRLLALVPQIQSGDPSNIEGRAAAVYWKVLFDKIEFTRKRFGEFPNPHLNYCYAILRAIVARALVGSGMLPTLGIFHRNKHNAYCLADDIMEPYRPFCDEIVYNMVLTGKIEFKIKTNAVITLVFIFCCLCLLVVFYVFVWNMMSKTTLKHKLKTNHNGHIYVYIRVTHNFIS